MMANTDHMFNFELKPTGLLNRVSIAGLTTEQEQHDDGDVWPHRLQMTNKLSTKLKKKTYHTLNQGFIWQKNCSSKKREKTQ